MKFKNKEELSKAYDELEKEFTKKCQENKKLREQLQLVNGKEIWLPKEGEEYWYISDFGKYHKTLFIPSLEVDSANFDSGNYFKTKEEVKKQAEYNKVMNRFRKYCEAYSDPLDWNDQSCEKWFVTYDVAAHAFSFICEEEYKDPFQIYASSKDILKDAIIYSAGSEEEFIRILLTESE